MVATPPQDAAPPAWAKERIDALRARVAQGVRGKDEVVELALVAVIAGGHILLEDVPGVGKTTLAWSLASALGGQFRRVQFTADLLPSDVLGTSVLRDGGLEFRPGPIFGNVVLADEINRSPPKTQSCLLEAMNEGAVSADGVTRPLPRPFLVVATQNPFDDQGTFPLPESQLDRFLLRLSMGYPDRESERAVLRAGALDRPALAPVCDPAAVLELCALAEQTLVHPEVEDYLLDLIARTRADGRLLRGVSTRGAGALYRAVRAFALCRGRRYVIPEDVRALALPVLAHRVLPRAEGPHAAARALTELLRELPAPGR
jgi:MoxR-like ATPase